MQVNGVQIKEAMSQWRLEKDTAAKQFNQSLFAFDGEEKVPVGELGERFHKADRNLALLEELQQLYNLNTTVRVGSETMTLSLAVKLVGGAGRLEKMWRSAATDDGLDRYSSRQTSRNRDEEFATRQISVDDCWSKSRQSTKHASQLRAAISTGNVENIITIGEGLYERFSPELFE